MEEQAEKIKYTSKWNWDEIEVLILSGKSPKEVSELPQFKGISKQYLANGIAKRGLIRKRDEMLAASKAQVGRNIVSMRAEGIEKHHAFSHDMLEKLRRAIADHRVKGSVKELRQLLDLFQGYLDAAETSYGLKDDLKSESAVSLNAMVALHIMPPSKAIEEPPRVEVIEMRVEPASGSDAGAGVEG